MIRGPVGTGGGIIGGRANVWSVRRATEADAKRLADFGRRTFASTFGPHNRPEDIAAYVAEAYGVEQQRAEITDPRWATLVAELDGDVIAFAQLQLGDAPPEVAGPAPVQLKRFYVDPAHHGRGVASDLLAAVHAAARELGARTIWLTVWERNPRALAFYLKSGFRDVGSTTFLLGGDPQTDRLMEAAVRALTEPAPSSEGPPSG